MGRRERSWAIIKEREMGHMRIVFSPHALRNVRKEATGFVI